MVLGFKELGLNASFVPLNDIIVNSKKISGNAQTRKEKNVLQHGTILIGVDVDKMFSLLLVPDEKLKGKMIETVKQRVTSVENELNRKVSFDEVAKAMKKALKKILVFAWLKRNLPREKKICQEYKVRKVL